MGQQYPDTFRLMLEKELSSNLSCKEDISATHEVVCGDNIKLKRTTDDGYVGVALVRSDSGDNFQNKIVFRKFA